jgi:homoserine kinase
MTDEIKVFAPASVTNVGCGFDILGFALDYPGDEVILRLKKKPGVVISKIINDGGKLPLDPEKNTAGMAVLSLSTHLKLKDGIELKIHKKMPQSSGLGSSAASAVAAVTALNEILGNPLKKTELIPFALEGEKISSGGKIHADNVAASLLGGFIIVRSLEPLDVIQIEYPRNLYCTVVHPHLELNTSEMRAMIGEVISLKSAVRQWGNIAGLVTGIIKSNYDLIRNSLQDVIIEPIRAKKIPGFYEAKQAALNEGALGSSISGSGPSIFALSTDKNTARNAAQKMKNVYKALYIDCDVYISRINEKGSIIVG